MIHDYARGWVVRCPACDGRGHLTIPGGARARCHECGGEGKHLAPPQWRDPWEGVSIASDVADARATAWSARDSYHHDIV